MIVWLIRHGLAAERDGTLFPDDDARPLLPKGERRLQALARFLAQTEPLPQSLLHSPVRRARESALVLASTWDLPRRACRIAPALHYEALPEHWLEALNRQRGPGPVACVGHEPQLSACLSLALTGEAEIFLPCFKKAGAAAVEWKDGRPAGRARLRWLLPPRLIRTPKDAAAFEQRPEEAR